MAGYPPEPLLLSRILERAGYTRVETTTFPTSVPEPFVDERPDLVLLDLHMPGMDGGEAGAAEGRPGHGRLMAVLAGDVTAPAS